jgi:hypothetical protein
MTLNRQNPSISSILNPVQPRGHAVVKCLAPQKNSCRKRSFQDLRNYFRPCNSTKKQSIVSSSSQTFQGRIKMETHFILCVSYSTEFFP